MSNQQEFERRAGHPEQQRAREQLPHRGKSVLARSESWD